MGRCNGVGQASEAEEHKRFCEWQYFRMKNPTHSLQRDALGEQMELRVIAAYIAGYLQSYVVAQRSLKIWKAEAPGHNPPQLARRWESKNMHCHSWVSLPERSAALLQ